MKKCNRCLEVKDLADFNKSARIKDGRRGDCRDCGRAANRANYLADPKKATRRRLAKLEVVAGRPRPKTCEVCDRGNGETRWDLMHFDHDHVTGKFRGWLCRKCNLVLGMVEDSSAVLRNLATYLDKSRE